METDLAPDATETGKTTAIIAYITVIGLIVAFVQNSEKKSAFAAYHIRQSLGLMLSGFVLGFINIIPILGWIISILGVLVLVIFWIVGLLNAINGRAAPVPVLGERYNKWFAGIGS